MMATIQYEVPNNVQRMTIGVQGENKVREFLFDVTEWRQITGNIGAAEMVVQRRGDTSPYAAAITMHDENTVSWVPTSTDTEKVGAGKLQLMWIAGGQTVKTKIFDMKVDPSLDYAVPDTSLDPWASWMPGIINADANYKGLTSRVDDLQQRQTSPYNFKGSVAALADLPSTGQEVNDTYYVEALKYRVTWTGDAWQQSSMEESKYTDELADLKNDFGSLDITKYLVSENGNYLAKNELNIDGYIIESTTGRLVASANYRCGYIHYPKPGTYKLYQPQSAFGVNYLKVPLYKGDKTFYRSVDCTSNDQKVVSFTLTEEDAKNAPFIGVTMRKPDKIYPMLLLNAEYPSNYSYTPPYYNFSDLGGLRYMGPCPTDANNAIKTGWYSHVTTSRQNLPSDYNIQAGCLIVFSPALNNDYGFQFLVDANKPPIIWYRYIKVDGSGQSSWMRLANKTEIDDILKCCYGRVVGKEFAPVSLSGNYLDPEKITWLPGIDTGGSINPSAGYYYAFVPLVGSGNYIRVMLASTFGVNATKVALYDRNKQWIKNIDATQIDDTNGFSFTLSPEDALTAVYTTVNYREAYPYYAALYYESDMWPLKVGRQSPKPNFKPITDPLYKCTFICDGDSIGAGQLDLPKRLQGWWGRIINDYSASGKNFSVGGGTITSELYFNNDTPRHWINESIDSIYSEYPELDYLILDGGTNDADIIGRFTGDTPPQKFGTWNNTDYSGNYDNETFCGAVETMFYKAVNHWPKAKIGFIIAMQMGRNNDSSANRRRYFDEIKKIANKWHIPVLDLWEESQMDSRLTAYYEPSMTGDENVTAKKCYYDGQHPTSYGYDLMQGKIDAWIRSL